MGLLNDAVAAAKRKLFGLEEDKKEKKKKKKTNSMDNLAPKTTKGKNPYSYRDLTKTLRKRKMEQDKILAETK